jgi:ribonuclease HII
MDGNLRTIVGVDEAGYGPRLGPLVVGLSAFRAPAYIEDLRPVLDVARPGGEVPVADSKALYRTPGDLRRLERSVLAFARLSREARLPDPPRDTVPWGPAFPVPLPVSCAPETVVEAAELLGGALRRTGIEVLALRTRTLSVAEFNRGVARHGSKAEVLFAAAAELLGPLLDGPEETVVHVDRHGGRAYYSRQLSTFFPGRCHLAIREGPRCSVYRFPREDAPLTVSFEVEADGLYLETALASMAAKWVREVHMRALNRYFHGLDPDLRPTAGYAVDAERWLRETTALRARHGVRDEDLLRDR